MKVPPKEILNTGLFNFEEAEQSAGWMEELEKDEHTPETEEYGISSFVYRSKKPFDPIRFWDYLQNQFPASIIRSKGLFWLASRPDQALVWSQAGGSLKAEGAGVWWASMLFHQRMKYLPFLENQKQIEKDWDKKFGDRKMKLYLLVKKWIKKKLDRNLISVYLQTKRFCQMIGNQDTQMTGQLRG